MQPPPPSLPHRVLPAFSRRGKSASANAPIFLPRPGLNMLRFGGSLILCCLLDKGNWQEGRRGRGGGGEGEGGGDGETFRDISTTAAFRIDRKLSTAVILTHTSSAFDADESKGGNGVLEESCRHRGGGEGTERGLVRRTRNSSRFVNAQGARLPGTY